MFRIDFLVDVIDIAVEFKATGMSELYFNDGHTVRTCFEFFKYVQDNNLIPYVYDHHRDGQDLVIGVRYEL